MFRNDNDEQVAVKKTDKKPKPEAAMAKTWRDLIPVIKCDVTSVSTPLKHFTNKTKYCILIYNKFFFFTESYCIRKSFGTYNVGYYI